MRGSTAFRAMAVATGLAALCSCSNFFGSSKKSSSTATPGLADYKITQVAAKSASDPQPFGTKVAAAVPRKQIYFDGVTYASSGSPQLIDYQANAATVQFAEGNSGWTQSPHATTAARLGVKGREGKESIVSVVFSLPSSTSFTVGDNKGTVSLEVWDGGATPTTYTPFGDETFDLYLCGWFADHGWNYQLNSELSIAAGDLTGDGKDEIGFCVGNRFVILDSGLSTVLYDGWATGSGSVDSDTSNMHPSRVAAGDIQGDGSVDFITTYGSSKDNSVGSYKIYGGSTPTVIASGSLGGGSCPLSLMYANVALGDLDGDGQKELIFAGREYGTNACDVVAADWNSASSNLAFWPKGRTIATGHGSDWGYNPIPPLVAFDPDPKTSTTTAYPERLLAWNTILSCDAASRTFSAGYEGLTTINMPVYANVCAADVNYDNQDELVSLSLGQVEVYSLGTGSSLKMTTIPLALSGAYSSLCAADLTGQSVTLKYIGATVKYTNPQLVAVLASPPYYADSVAYPAFGNAATSFGTTSSSSTSYSNSLTLSASFSIGVNDDCPLWGSAAEEEYKYTFGTSFTYGFESSKEVSCSHVYSTMAGSDAVIYSCIPFDVYSYEVLSSPNSAAVGKTVTVDFPREPQVILMDRTTFNALPDNPISVGASVLCHTLGVPGSYRNKQAVTGLCSTGDGLMDTGNMSSPTDGAQYATSTVSVSRSTGATVGTGLSFSASLEVTVLGCLFGAELGFSDEFEYSVTTTNGTEISGSVPGISPKDTLFHFGIAGYKLTDTRLQPTPFMVVTYWVN